MTFGEYLSVERTQAGDAGEYLRRRLQGLIGQRLALPAGSARVWWPALARSCDPAAHPLVLALDSGSEARMLEEFARQFDLSRPLVRGC